MKRTRKLLKSMPREQLIKSNLVLTIGSGLGKSWFEISHPVYVCIDWLHVSVFPVELVLHWFSTRFDHSEWGYSKHHLYAIQSYQDIYSENQTKRTENQQKNNQQNKDWRRVSANTVWLIRSNNVFIFCAVEWTCSAYILWLCFRLYSWQIIIFHVVK